MIRHDHREAMFLRLAQLIDRSDAVITGKKEVHAGFYRFMNDPRIDPVSVIDPVRNPVIRMRAQGMETPQEDACRTDAVNIIISYNADMLMLLYCLQEDARSLLKIGQEQLIIQLLHAAVQEIPDLFLCNDIPVPQYPCRNLVDPEAPGYFTEIRFFRINVPLTVHRKEGTCLHHSFDLPDPSGSGPRNSSNSSVPGSISSGSRFSTISPKITASSGLLFSASRNTSHS